MATKSAKVGGGSVVNDGGTVVAAGTVPAGSPVSKVLNVNELNTGSEYGSKVVVNTATGNGTSDPAGAIKARTSGTFAYYPSKEDRNFLIRAAGSTSAGKINNTSSTLLTVPGGVSTNGNTHKLTTTRRIGQYSNAVFNVLARPSTSVVPGRTRGTGAGSLVNYVEMDGVSPSQDDAASSTRSVPGELTYHFGKLAAPYSDDYKAKDSFES